MVLHWYCLRINIYESIHKKLKLSVTMKHLQLCIFFHNFLLFCLIFFNFFNFWCFTCKSLQQMFPQYMTRTMILPIRFLIHILVAINRLDSNSLCHGLISRLLFVLFPIKATHFSSTVKTPSLPLVYQPWSLPRFLLIFEPWDILFFHNISHSVIRYPLLSNHITETFIVFE